MSPRSLSKKAAGHDIQDALSWHSSALLALFIFTVLAAFGLALWTLKLYVTEQQIATAVGLVASTVTIPSVTTPAGTVGTIRLESTELNRGSGFPMLSYMKIPCAGDSSGTCYDYSILDPKSGSVPLVPSVRIAMAASGLESAGLPEALSMDERYMTLRAGNPGSTRGMLTRIVTVDLGTGDVKMFPTDVDDCVTYSADGLYAADMPLVRAERRSVVVHDLLGGTSKTVATASKDELFGVATGTSGAIDEAYPAPCDPPLFVNATSVRFNVYSSPTETHVASVLEETRTATFSF